MNELSKLIDETNKILDILRNREADLTDEMKMKDSPYMRTEVRRIKRCTESLLSYLNGLEIDYALEELEVRVRGGE
jgi:hypothetical protein